MRSDTDSAAAPVAIRRAPCYVFDFGKHKGRTIWAVEDASPSYIRWCACNVPRFLRVLRERHPELLERMRRARKILASAEDAWAFEGGRMPRYDDVYRKVFGSVMQGAMPCPQGRNPPEER